MVIHLKFPQRSSYRKRNEWGQCVITAGKQKHARNIGLQAFLQKICGNRVGGGALARCILAADDSLGQLGKNQGSQPGSNVWSILPSLALISTLSSVLSEMFIVYFVLVYFKCLFVLERKISFCGPYRPGSDFCHFSLSFTCHTRHALLVYTTFCKPGISLPFPISLILSLLCRRCHFLFVFMKINLKNSSQILLQFRVNTEKLLV